MRNVSNKHCSGNQNTRFCSQELLPKIVPVLRYCGKNIVEPGKPQMTKWRMRIACWIPRATNTHSGYILIENQQMHQNEQFIVMSSQTLVHVSAY
jgi:hypothetical protein